MIDKRLEKLARVLVDHSLEIKKNDLFVISGSQVATPLIKEVYKQALKRGAYPYTRVGINDLAETYFRSALSLFENNNDPIGKSVVLLKSLLFLVQTQFQYRFDRILHIFLKRH